MNMKLKLPRKSAGIVHQLTAVMAGHNLSMSSLLAIHTNGTMVRMIFNALIVIILYFFFISILKYVFAHSI
jgi:hypothetical protein